MTGRTRRDRGDLPKEGGGMTSKRGLTNGSAGDASMAMAVDVGLINGLPNGGGARRGRQRPLLGRGRKWRAAAREAMERKARRPLPGAGDE